MWAFDCDADAYGDLPVGLTYNTFPSPHSHTLSLSEKVASSGQASRPRNMISKVIASKLTRQRMESIISIRHITPCCCSASKLDPTGISPTFKIEKAGDAVLPLDTFICTTSKVCTKIFYQMLCVTNHQHQLSRTKLSAPIDQKC